MPPEPANPQRAGQPLLTIAVPTYNRAAELCELLDVLRAQLAEMPQVELLVSDNASTDETAQVLAEEQPKYAACGARLEMHRHPVNVGADANFAFCFRQARGRFFWMCGDDDRIVPGALEQVLGLLERPEELDMIYATSYGFRKDWRAEEMVDPLGRHVHIIRDARTFSKVVNIMFTFISGMVVNKERLMSLPHEDSAEFLGTNLVQLSWTLPLLLDHRRSAVLWTRPVAARVGHAQGYSLGHVFGTQLKSAVERLLPGRPDLSEPIVNFALRRWFPSMILDVRKAGNTTLQLDAAPRSLRAAYGSNPRYWLFTWPTLWMPLPLARAYTRLTAWYCKMVYMMTVPHFWKKETR